jgi:FKBP-type peptidyl-prolyl cis-trans isomerase FkpA
MKYMKIFSGTAKTLLGCLWLLASCNGCHDPKVAKEEQVVTMDDLVRNNKKAHQEEMKAIEQYVQDKKWPVSTTATGIHYWVYETGEGALVRFEEMVAVAYHIELMDGTVCYDAPASQPKKFKVGHDNVESGLHEMVQLMRPGDKAKVVLPSHLAFGLTGDSNKIPQNATVIYDLEIVGTY